VMKNARGRDDTASVFRSGRCRRPGSGRLQPAVPVSICRWGRSIIPVEESRVGVRLRHPDEAVQVRGLPTSPLEIATKGNSQIADRLLSEHCDVNAANNVGQTAS